MQKSFGISALVIAIVCIFIPIVGPWLTILAAALAAFACGPGFSLGLAAIIINLFNIFVISPSVWITIAANEAAKAQGRSFASIGTILFAAQAIAAILLIAGSSRKRKNRLRPDEALRRRNFKNF